MANGTGTRVARSRRRILLAVQPAALEGALATLLGAGDADDVVQLGRAFAAHEGGYVAAVMSDELPEGVQAGVVIILPDTRDSGGTATVTTGQVVRHVSIAGADRVVELLEEYG